MPDEFHYRWQYDLHSSPEALWPYVSDTNRFNQETGVPPVEDMRPGLELVNARRHLRLRRSGMWIKWEEEPFEWVRPYRFGVRRVYSSGPVSEMRTLAELSSRPEGGTRLVYQVWARPRNLLGYAAIPLQIGRISARAFAAAFYRYDTLAAQGESPGAAPGQPPGQAAALAPGSGQRLQTAGAEMQRQGVPPELAGRLIDLIIQADDITLSRLRPYALADYWRLPRRATLEAFLHATRAGLFDLQWHILCPLCRGDKETAASLNAMATRAHCEVCHIDLGANFDQAVELTFRPNPAIRPLEIHPYCVGGPQVTPHILAQQLLPPRATRDLSLPLEPGRHHLRAVDLPGGRYLQITAGGASEATLRASADGWPGEELSLGTNPLIHLANDTDRQQLLLLERLAWSDQAVTAAEVTTLQAFRDLFSSEALRPGEQISVGSLTIVFTDLRDSTRLYQAIGDAPAFGRVMSHFDILRQTISAEEGAIVKTIGDAVMAAFRRPLHGLKAILRAQELLAAQPGGAGAPLVLKAGLHHGPCIAVTLNGRLDYFGSTVNVAARIQNLAAGEDIVLSNLVRDDPEVAAWLHENAPRYELETLRTTLKGLEGTFEVYRLQRT
ncbi:MAG: hypothetical protein K1X65_17750 [Caldilineales bacterium]|nr:hypothetical protein [Caldilineales bacterium]MCW5860443.1 hypothetical protein [Caldilineales bacterium]